MPTPLKPDPLGLESSQPFKGPVSTRHSTKLNYVEYSEQEHNQSEDDFNNQQHCRQLEEEFEAEYDYPGQEEEHQQYGQPAAETSDSEDETSDDSGPEVENNVSILHQEESLQRGKKRRSSTALPQEESQQKVKKRHNEEGEEEEGEVSDDGDGNQSQVNST